MKVNDVWRSIDQHLSVYVKGNFDQIPESSGVYAWFYPLKMSTNSLEDLVHEFRVVHSYDANSEGEFVGQSEIAFKWDKLLLDVKLKPSFKELNSAIYEQWNETLQDQNKSLELRKSLMSASILMPPLYIGKSYNLRERCAQHLNNEKEGCFKSRFETFAKSNGLSSQSVRELIFVTILAGENKSKGYSDEQSLIEEILKLVAKPSYGKL